MITFIAFVGMFVIGMITGCALLVYSLYLFDRSERKKRSMNMHPSSQEALPFNVRDISQNN
jgi:hypothetical protein